MANNKVQLADGTVLIDLTGDNVQPGNVEEGITFHDSSGTQRSGTLQRGAQVASGSVTTNRKSYMDITPGFIVRKLLVHPLNTKATTAIITYDVDNNICTGINGTSTITPTITSTSDHTKISNGTGKYFNGDYYWLATS